MGEASGAARGEARCGVKKRGHIIDCPCLDCAGRVHRLDDRDRGACVAVVRDKHGDASPPMGNGGRWVSAQRPRDARNDGPL